MTPGHRVRVLAEVYDPAMDAQQAQQWADSARKAVQRELPDATVIVYVEANPPADEL